MTAGDKSIRWLATEIKTPPFSREARIEAGVLVFAKKSQTTPKRVLATCRRRMKAYDDG